MSDTVYTQNNCYQMPDVQIVNDLPEYIYTPLRGYSACLAVFDLEDRCIGWIDTRTLGFEDAKAWMVGVNWKDGGY